MANHSSSSGRVGRRGHGANHSSTAGRVGRRDHGANAANHSSTAGRVGRRGHAAGGDMYFEGLMDLQIENGTNATAHVGRRGHGANHSSTAGRVGRRGHAAGGDMYFDGLMDFQIENGTNATAHVGRRGHAAGGDMYFDGLMDLQIENGTNATARFPLTNNTAYPPSPPPDKPEFSLKLWQAIAITGTVVGAIIGGCLVFYLLKKWRERREFTEKMNAIKNLAKYQFHRPQEGDDRRATLVPMGTGTHLDRTLSERHTDCAICKDPYAEEEEIYALPCPEAHHYHPRCIEPWLQKKAICPLCKYNIIKRRFEQLK